MMDSGTIGHLAVFIALVFNLMAGVAYLAAARGKSSYEYLGRYSYHIFTGAVTVGVIYLFYLFFSHDFSMDYVARYSDRALPFFYLLSAFWAGQEGTYLLWLFLNALFGYIIIKRGGQYRNYAMTIFALANMFLLTLLIKLSPFAAAPVVHADGLGLNPLLQDPWMVIHPPVIFVGYSMAAVPFAIAMAALILNDYSEWVKRTFACMVITSLMLAAGNILGGYWAYKTLGWGGFWAWDPVENSSLVPWFVSLAVIHGLLIERRSGALRKINILMTAFTFWLVVYGTFLTRSGVLSDFSVHSFIDLGINNYLVGFLLLYLIVTAALFIPRIKSLKPVPLDYNFWGREFILFAAAMLLFIFSVIVLFWSSLPILTTLVGSEPRAADISTYNSFALPLAVIYCLLLAAAPFSKFQPFSLSGWKTTILPVIGGAAVLGFGLFYLILDAELVFAFVFSGAIGGLLIYFLNSDMLRELVPGAVAFILAIIIALVVGVRDYMYLLYLGVAAMAIVSNLIVVVRLASVDWKKMGGQLAHLGFGVMLIGTLGATAYSTNEKAVLKRGESAEAYGLVLSYQGMEHDLQYPHNELILMISDGDDIEDARPELYYDKRSEGLMRQPYIRRSLLYDIYFSPEQLRELGDGGGLTLREGHPVGLGDFVFTFQGFEMSGHGGGGMDGMTVAANIEVREGDSVYMVQPTSGSHGMGGGQSEMTAEATTFGAQQYEMSIKKILVDRGAVSLSIPGLTEDSPPDELVIDVSKKPIISLVWGGTTILMLGVLVGFIRRRKELYS